MNAENKKEKGAITICGGWLRLPDALEEKGSGITATREGQKELVVLTSHEAANPSAPQRIYTHCYSPIDWPQYRDHENGNYINACIFCNREFVGHKRQQGCRECSADSVPDASEKKKEDLGEKEA